jgi:hypothetical protein
MWFEKLSPPPVITCGLGGSDAEKIEEIAKPAVGTDAADDCRGFGTSRERL